MQTYRFNDLLARGLEEAAVRSLVKGGDLHRIRHGGYLAEVVPDAPEDAHRALLATTMPLLTTGSVLSHGSAGLLWGLPVPSRLLQRVHATRDRASGGSVSNCLHSHSRVLRPGDVERLDGILVTSLARTAIALSCTVRAEEALAIMDAAWRLAAGDSALAMQLAAARRRKGVPTARWALSNASPLSESPGESRSRYWMIVSGIEPPELQFEVRDAAGVLIGRSDFAWPERRVLGEFDGRVKYEPELIADGSSVADIVMREKRRENRLRAEGWWVHRWTWADLRDGYRFAGTIRGVLDRGSWLTPTAVAAGEICRR